MRPDWQSVPLKTIVDPDRGITYGIVQPGSAAPDGVPIVRVSDIRGGRISTFAPLRVSKAIEAAYGRSRLKGGELLLTLVGTVGEAAVVPQSLAGWNTARAVAVIPVRKDVGAYWVQLAMRTPAIAQIIGSRLNTTVQATLNLRDVEELPIALPPIAEREAICDVVGTLDKKIDLNVQLGRGLEDIFRAAFTSWFMAIDPAAPGWRKARLGEIAANLRRTVRPDDIRPGTPYVALEHLIRYSLTVPEWGTADRIASGKFEFRRGEILFGKLRPYFHKVGIGPIDGVCSTDILVIAPSSPAWRGFVVGHVSSDAFVAHATSRSNGTKMPRTNWADLADYELALPPESRAASFTTLVDPILERIVSTVHELNTLRTIRDTVVPRLLSGRTRVTTAAAADYVQAPPS